MRKRALRISRVRRLAVVVALAVGLVLGLAVMAGCGSGCPTSEQEAYFKEAEDWTERTKAASGELTTTLYEGGSRPELVLDEGWRRRLRRILDEMDVASRQMIAREPPAGTEEVHGTIVRVSEAVIEANELLWQGVLDVNAGLIDRSNERRREATRLAEELIRVVELFCE